ncbi:MAG: hypothetical protein ACI4RF_00900 [Eubacterium sp.]
MILKKILIHSFCDNHKREKITQYEYNVGSFAFELYDSKEKPVNLTECKSAAYYGTKADGTLIGNECEISDNRVIITPTLQMTACAGLLKGIIECQFESGNIRFFGINFEILPAPEKAEIESADEFTVLDRTLAQARLLLEKAESGEFNGSDGADGVGITKSEINSSGELVLTYSDNTVSNLGVVVGADGKDGVNGTNGINGTNGKNGADGIGISAATINSSGELVITYSDGTSANLGTVVGADGKDGQDGADLSNEVEDIKAYIGYTDSDILGLQVDFENKTFTRLAGAAGLSAGADFDQFSMYGGRKRCNVSDDGTITAYYGDENYAEDGSNGQVMVYQPAFYYKVVPLKLEPIEGGIGYHQRKTNFYISATPKAGFKLHPAFYDANGNAVDYILYSAYEGSMYDVSAAEYVNDGTNTDTAIETGDLLCSVAGVKPISGLYKKSTKANLELMAQSHGSGWHLEPIKATSANQMLMIIELGTMNVQTAIGRGLVDLTGVSGNNCASLTGSTSELGNSTGQATETISEIGGVETVYTESGKVAVTYRGIENPWGNLWKLINGANTWGDGTMAGGQLYIADDFNFAESKSTDNYKPVGFTISNASGYLGAIGYGSEEYDWLFIPSEVGGTSALPVGDYCYVAPNVNGYKSVRNGGYLSYGALSGSFCWAFSDSGGYSSNTTGGRLLYVPTAKV